MEKKYIYQCEDSVEGILTGIYDAWASVHSHEENCIEVRGAGWEMPLLFAEYTEVVPDAEKSEKYFRELTGLDENKPFECVGTRSEVVMCLKKYLEKGGTALLPVKYRDWLSAQPGDVDTALSEWNTVHGVPEELAELVRKELGVSPA